MVVLPTIVVESDDVCFVGGAPPAKTHQAFNPKHQPSEDVAKQHQEASKPAWLLALEIVTGTMVGLLFLVAVLTAFQRCNNKSSIIIPWKKSASQNDYTAVYIGLLLASKSIPCLFFITTLTAFVTFILNVLVLHRF